MGWLLLEFLTFVRPNCNRLMPLISRTSGWIGVDDRCVILRSCDDWIGLLVSLEVYGLLVFIQYILVRRSRSYGVKGGISRNPYLPS